MPTSAKTGLNFNASFFFLLFKSIFSNDFLYSTSTREKVTEFAFKLSYVNSNFRLNLGYLNPSLNNPALNGKRQNSWLTLYKHVKRTQFTLLCYDLRIYSSHFKCKKMVWKLPVKNTTLLTGLLIVGDKKSLQS